MSHHIVITGGRGRMGRVLLEAWSNSRRLTLLDREEGCDLSRFAADAVVHLAVDFGDPEASLAMLETVLRTSVAPKLIHASSLTVDPHSAVTEKGSYVDAKIEAERRLSEWAQAHPDKRYVALRFGHFNPSSTPPHDHEAVRLTSAGLLYWVERALSDEPALGRLTIWTATGRGGNPLKPEGRA